ncbi:MAG TPA: c-type cytochrome biogenesis protein CcmI [Burkholderiales bacterium]|nr:c-type cytochrome biogenesis protein CcmI [Burkholderiales bacterium]
MTAFWLVAALFIAGALALVLPPLLRGTGSAGRAGRDAANIGLYREELADLEREQAEGKVDAREYREAKEEIERRLLEDVAPAAPGRQSQAPAQRASRRTALAIGIALPVVVVLGYLRFGDMRALEPGAQQTGHDVTSEQIATMVDKLAQRMQQNPGDAQGWVMLGRSYAVLGRFAESSQAYARAVALVNDDAGLLADYADSLAMSRGGNLEGEPYQIVKRGLEFDPKNVKLLALAGSAEFQNKDYAAAVGYWERSLAGVQGESDFSRELRSSIDEARRLGNLPVAQALAPAPAAAATKSAISGTVRLAPALAGKVSPGDTLFVFARPAEGSRMPVAILRVSAEQLPYAFRLDDSQAMTPANKLSDQKRVLVGARISKSGDALPHAGDLEASSAQAAPGTDGLVLTIDQVVKN